MGKVNLAINLAKHAVNFAKNGKNGISLAERSANFVKTCGKESILMAKPQTIKGLNFAALKFAPNLKGDVCAFSKDPSLAPELLDDLLKIKGTKVEKVEQIKNRFLQAMGYKNPELVKLDNQTFNCDMAIDFLDGKLSVTDKEFPMELLIASERHELDHLDKFAKLVKAEGVDKVENASMTGLYKHFSKVEKQFDREFWLKMSKDADITDFDSKKYIEALENYRYDTVMQSSEQNSFYYGFLKQHLYCTNEFEKSAYGIQKKVLKHYSADDITQYDFSGEQFGKVKKLLEEMCEDRSFYEPKGFLGTNSFDQLYTASLSMADPAGVKYLKYLRDTQNGKIAQNPEKIQEALQGLNEIGARPCNGKQAVQVLENVYNWLKEGKYTFDDVLPP